MSNFENNYEKQEKIGEGTYGAVYRARNIQTNEIVAVKKIKVEEDDDGIPQTALREITILKRLNHKNIVKLLDINYDYQKKKLYLIFEYAEYDLRKFLNQNKNISKYQQKTLLQQIVKGVQYLHENRIFHRDLKPQNILVDKYGVCKIADFGLSRIMKFPQIAQTHEIQTLWYRAPEVLLGCKVYSQPVDLWSIGCIFAEIVHGFPLFQGCCEIEQIFKIFQYHGTPDEENWSDVYTHPHMKKTFPKFEKSLNYQEQLLPKFDKEDLQIFSILTHINPEQRLDCNQVLSHNFFEGQ